MSLTTEQIISEAKKLASKVKECDTIADNLIIQSQKTYKQIDAMKQYKEDVGDLNLSARQKTHSALVTGMQQENRYLRDLQQENKELRAALEDHQNALELIMSKYRQQVSQLIDASKLDLPKLHNQQYIDIIQGQSTKISEMAAVMAKAALAGDENLTKEANINRLATENQGLRELLSISNRCGSKPLPNSLKSLDPPQ